eukprot:gene10943-3649_t
MLKVVLVLAFAALISANIPVSAVESTSLQNEEPSEAWMFYNYDVHPCSSAYCYVTGASWDGKDMTQWLQSYFMTNNVNGRLPNSQLPFQAAPYTISSGDVHYSRAHKYLTSKFNDFQPVTFPEVAGSSLPIIQKVLYGTPGHDIDMTAWFRNYFIQHQVNGKLENHLIHFHHVYGDPQPNVQKQFKITYYYTAASTIWMAPRLKISEQGQVNFPEYGLKGVVNNPTVIDAKYGEGNNWAADVRNKFTKWVSQSPRNGAFHGTAPGWNTLFGDPSPNRYKDMYIYYARQISFPSSYDLNYYLNGVAAVQYGEHDHVVFPPSNQGAYPVILSVEYGTDSHKIDVTAKFLKFFMENMKDTGRVNAQYAWNNYFGDPVPNVVKKLFFRYGYPKTYSTNTLDVENNIEEEDIDSEFDLDEDEF